MWVLFLVILIFVYRSWFSFSPLSGGDWEFLHPEATHFFTLVPSAWSPSNGLGTNSILPLWIRSFYQATSYVFTHIFKIPWVVTEKIIWFWPFLAFSFVSSWCFTKQIFGRGKNYFLLFTFYFLLFVSNTYILMIVGGGQMGVALAYSVAPLVLQRFMDLLSLSRLTTLSKLKAQSSKLKATTQNLKLLRKTIVLGLILAIQIMFDPRIAYITLLACGLYAVYQWYLKKLNLFLSSVFCLLSSVIVLGLHAFWILPMVVSKSGGLEALGTTYTTVEAVKYFSFAQFSNTISLLHPNWPENIFGKVYFMRAEFLILPILAFSSLLFIRQITKNKKQITKNRNTIFFSLLGLLGAFLAKGANPPFGGVYLWLFRYFPGFIAFRDPTKFYLLIALSYSTLIPYSLSGLGKWIREITKNRKQITENR